MMPGNASVRRSIANAPLRRRRCTRGPVNDLHTAARIGFVEAAMAILAEGLIDIDQGDPEGLTPLMMACSVNCPSIVRILLNKGANVEIALDDGYTALHLSAEGGHLAVTNFLTEAGADLEATVTCDGWSPLQQAVRFGHLQVATALIQAGANVNHRGLDGSTPLFTAAWNGRVECVRVLLRANASPFLSRVQPPLERKFTPLDAAAQHGHASVARELIPHLGSEAIGGAANEGVVALRVAAQHGHVNVMAVLTDAGVVDTGTALVGAAGFGNYATVSYLLWQEQQSRVTRGSVYADSRDRHGRPALLLCIANCRPCSPRIARMLIDAGADATSTVRVKGVDGSVAFHDTPLAFLGTLLVTKSIQGEDATEEQLHLLEAIRRLLLQVEAVRAVSWAWPNWPKPEPCVAYAADGARRTNTASAMGSPLSRMLPTLRLRATRRRVRWAALSRHSKKL